MADDRQQSSGVLELRWATLVLVAVAFAAYVVVFAESGLDSILFAAPFTMTPFAVSGVLAWRWRTVAGQTALIVGAIGYGVWFWFTYMRVMHWNPNPDPQSGIALMLVGIYAAPVLGLLWWGGWWLEKRGRIASEAEPYDPGVGS